MKFKYYVSLTKLSAAIIYEKAGKLASASGVMLKDYISDPENIRHMSLILYDLLPLSIKITLRHETFYKYLTSLIKKMQEPLVIEDPKHTKQVQPSDLKSVRARLKKERENKELEEKTKPLTNAYPSILNGEKLVARPLPDNFDMTTHQKLMKDVREGKRVIKATSLEEQAQLIQDAKDKQEEKKIPKKRVSKKEISKE